MRERAIAYRERLRVPIRWWLQGALMVASFWLAMIVSIPASLAWGLTTVLFALLALCLVAYGSARIEVAAGWLHVGRARIEQRFVGAVESLDVVQMRSISGPEADARAFLMLRPYLSRGVRVQINDPADPTPYWLISSRRPAALAAALHAAKGQPAEVADR